MIPVGDTARSRSTPWVTWVIIAVTVGAFLRMLTLSDALAPNPGTQLQQFDDQTNGICYGYRTAPTALDRFYCRWSFQPREWFDAASGKTLPPADSRVAVLLTIVTAIFLHAGWLHILGNMLFLWVFGDNVEDRMGHFGYLLFYLVAGVVAGLTQAFINPDSVTPVVGASGAIAGVLGAYIIWFPRATVRVIIPFFILIFIPLPVPAVVMIGLWFLQNLLSGVATLGNVNAPDAGVAFFAHIGGFVFGAALVLLVLKPLGRGAPRWPER
ncbi:MAG: rhomboid family intramembrane serine protease [Chloroflexi bacterium]|nr:rhomboid family intramembrane serine protease [Chloroflexota bacterium]